MNEAAWIMSTSKEEIFSQLWQAMRNMNGNLDKLTDLTQNLENKLNVIKKVVEQK